MSRSSTDRSAKFERILFVVAVLFTLIVPVTVGLIFRSDTVSWIALICGAFVVLASRFDTLAEFSLGPLRARMRETLDEATATISQLREMASTMTFAILADLIAGSFMGSMPTEMRLKVHDELVDRLRSLGCTPDQLTRAESEWKKGIGLIYHRIIRSHMLKAANLSGSEHNKLSSDIQELSDFPTWTVSGPSRFEDMARQRDILTPEVETWIDDFRHFQTTNEIRRRDEFVKG